MTSPLERRRLLGLLGTSAIIGVAGCIGADDDDDDNDDDEGGTTYDPTIEHSGDGPIEFTSSQSCAVCGMTPTDYPDHRSQVAHENGEGAITCSPGCLTAYIVTTTSDSAIVAGWTTEITTGDLVDALEAHFVLITDEAAADDPMGIDPRPFADREDALEFIEEWDAEELSEDDIIGFEEIDRDVAEIYRGNRI